MVRRLPRPVRERRVFVETSAYFALLDPRDEHHAEAVTIVGELARQRYRQSTTNILDAISFAVMQRLGIEAAFTFGHHFGQYGFRISAADQLRADF